MLKKSTKMKSLFFELLGRLIKRKEIQENNINKATALKIKRIMWITETIHFKFNKTGS